MPNVRAGALRNRITVKEETRVDDGQGNYTKTWGGVGHEWPIWAKREYVSDIQTGGDTAEHAQTVSRRRFAYTVRRRSDVVFTSAMRITDGEIDLAITAVQFDDKDVSAQQLIAVELQP